MAAPVRIPGECMTGAQDHFYLETQVSLAVL
jgi:xanthine dehydrogenase large subunit